MRSLAAPAPLPRRRPPPQPARPPSAPALVLQLQRTIGNRATRSLLRDTAAHPAALDKPRAELPPLGAAGLDQAAWSAKVKAAREALADDRRRAEAIRLYTELYKDLAASAGADKLRDVGKDLPVNLAKANDEGFAPGLNLVLGSGGAKGGTTGFIDDGGRFGVPLDPRDKRRHVAIRLYSSTFGDDKLAALATLRHEMLHVHHHELALAALDGKRPASAVDKALVDELKAGGASNSELLAYVEGFMTVFHRLDPPPGPTAPIFVELLGMLETTKVTPWRSAKREVRDEALGRLREYYCDTLDAKHQAAFEAWVTAEATQAQTDAEALGSRRNDGSVATAKSHRDLMFEHFVRGLQEVVAQCGRGRRREPAPRRRTSADPVAVRDRDDLVAERDLG